MVTIICVPLFLLNYFQITVLVIVTIDFHSKAIHFSKYLIDLNNSIPTPGAILNDYS